MPLARNDTTKNAAPLTNRTKCALAYRPHGPPEHVKRPNQRNADFSFARQSVGRISAPPQPPRRGARGDRKNIITNIIPGKLD
ncbi:hypothetical protein EVAR_62442_1 [Eumeta japonica]|uniref:Uncharacterized protein n=1 Tax=Eumeta variegata TaxID=151549 RepID=A0A4C1Z0C7_EUMVA|nr:hypothetical protein EVAR_62442_1 [Eumeta japonica]